VYVKNRLAFGATSHNSQYIITLQDISKIYTVESQKVEALRSVSLDIKKGEIAAVTGKSGAGKSTLVGLLMRFYDVTHG
jgi:putative ABC transport system ATP-binding protein